MKESKGADAVTAIESSKTDPITRDIDAIGEEQQSSFQRVIQEARRVLGIHLGRWMRRFGSLKILMWLLGESERQIEQRWHWFPRHLLINARRLAEEFVDSCVRYNMTTHVEILSRFNDHVPMLRDALLQWTLRDVATLNRRVDVDTVLDGAPDIARWLMRFPAHFKSSDARGSLESSCCASAEDLEPEKPRRRPPPLRVLPFEARLPGDSLALNDLKSDAASDLDLESEAEAEAEAESESESGSGSASASTSTSGLESALGSEFPPIEFAEGRTVVVRRALRRDNPRYRRELDSFLWHHDEARAVASDADSEDDMDDEESYRKESLWFHQVRARIRRLDRRVRERELRPIESVASSTTRVASSSSSSSSSSSLTSSSSSSSSSSASVPASASLSPTEAAPRIVLCHPEARRKNQRGAMHPGVISLASNRRKRTRGSR